MAQEYNVTWQEYNGTDYDTLYPKTKAVNVAINPTTSLSDVVVYGEPLRYNLSQQSLYFHKNGLLINRQTNNVDMYLSYENKDYTDIYHLIDLNGIPTLIDKVASSITGATSYIPGVITEETRTILTFTPDGYGTLSELIINATQSGTFDNLRILIYNGTNLIWQSEPITSWGTSLTIQPNIGVLDGNTYSVKMRIVNTGPAFSISAGTFTANITGEVYQSGYFTTKQFTMTDGNKLQTWLYYTGTAPAVSYNVGSGSCLRNG